MAERFITVAIHTYEKAVALRSLLESEGIKVEFRNVNIEAPVVSSGVRVRICENDLPLALRIIENREIFTTPAVALQTDDKHPVLVPVDFTDRSLNAVKYAFDLAAAHNTSITLLHTYIDPYVAGTMQLTDSLTYEINDNITREQIMMSAQTQMRHFATRLRDSMKSGEITPVKFDTVVEEGVPEDTIAEYARQHNPFLIVMGTRGHQEKETDMIGSVTAEVLDKCRNTVLAIPPAVNASINLENVVFFGSADQQDILALDTLYRVFPRQGVNVTIAAMPPKKRQFMRNTSQALDAICDYCRNNFKGYTFTPLELDRDNAHRQISNFDNDKHISLIVVPNRKKNVFSRLFNPTLAHRLLFTTNIPMLVIPV